MGARPSNVLLGELAEEVCQRPYEKGDDGQNHDDDRRVLDRRITGPAILSWRSRSRSAWVHSWIVRHGFAPPFDWCFDCVKRALHRGRRNAAPLGAVCDGWAFVPGNGAPQAPDLQTVRAADDLL